MTNLEIGERIKLERCAMGFTMQELADMIGVATSTIQRYETGSIKKIKLPIIEAIANKLNLNPSWLVGKSDEKYSAETSNSGKWTSPPQLTNKDHKDIEKFINNMANELSTAEGLMFDGEPASDEDVESIINAMRVGVEMVKLKNKEKYTPKKYRK
ncbi:helix-turn-helix domain-containing protein [Eubacterium barkeri]|uniref:Helix-turn-helix domain-containing protein n=1 Tax=Eubacterium barkeri TaxID=1528 RepID=A0A1H3HFW6_EUBBA|nr:helix-turn-helix domain-containing protein [Eubacterium barkeri]SDY14220.1 Helix-turn-helix domain-containing protein [Eubacterium barkeri]